MRKINNEGSKALGAVIIILIILLIVFLSYNGFISLNISGEEDSDINNPIGSDYCGFTDGEMIDMFENLIGKDLNNDVGYSVINALNMEACGSNSKLPEEIIAQYSSDFAKDGWHLINNDAQTRTGYYYTVCIWGNAPTLQESSMIRGIISGNGNIIKSWYNYETLTITSEGTKTGYYAFLLWIS